MGANGMTEREPSSRVAEFLREEGFYVFAVLLVAVPLAVQSLITVHALLTDRPLPLRTDHVEHRLKQETLETQYAEQMKTLRERAPEKLRFPLAMRYLNYALWIAGIVVLLAVALPDAIRRRGAILRPIADPAWGLWDVLKLAACYAIGVAILRWIFDTPFANRMRMPQYWLSGLFGYVLLLGMMRTIVLIERNGSPRQLGARREGIGRAALIGVLGFIGVMPLFHLMVEAQAGFFKDVPVQEALQALWYTKSPTVLALSVFTAVVGAPVAEEFLFRGMLQPALQRWFNPWTGWVLTALFFGFAHGSPALIVPLFVLGLALGYVHSRARSIVAPITLHALFNGLSLLSMFSYRYVHQQVT